MKENIYQNIPIKLLFQMAQDKGYSIIMNDGQFCGFKQIEGA